MNGTKNGVDLSLNSFADIENNLFEAEGYNNSFRFFKASHQIDQIESQITLIEEDIAAFAMLWQIWRNKSLKIVDVFFIPWTCLKSYNTEWLIILKNMAKVYLKSKNNWKISNQSFLSFVTLNTSGDPVEAAVILDNAENHILALSHIVDRLPAIVKTLSKELPDQLEDLEDGYRKLLDANYHFAETDIESRFQLLYEALKKKPRKILHN